MPDRYVFILVVDTGFDIKLLACEFPHLKDILTGMTYEKLKYSCFCFFAPCVKGPLLFNRTILQSFFANIHSLLFSILILPQTGIMFMNDLMNQVVYTAFVFVRAKQAEL